MLRRSDKDYYCVKFQAIPIRGFRVIVLTYTPTHILSSWKSDRHIRAPVIYVVGADNSSNIVISKQRHAVVTSK